MDLSRITIEPDIGTPYIRDTDITVGQVVELAEAGFDDEEILGQLPGLTLDDLDAALEWDTEFGARRPGSDDPRITVDPAIQHGQPIITGTRIPVEVVVAMWERGFGVDEIVADYPTLTPEDVEAAVGYSAGFEPDDQRSDDPQ